MGIIPRTPPRTHIRLPRKASSVLFTNAKDAGSKPNRRSLTAGSLYFSRGWRLVGLWRSMRQPGGRTASADGMSTFYLVVGSADFLAARDADSTIWHGGTLRQISGVAGSVQGADCSSQLGRSSRGTLGLRAPAFVGLGARFAPRPGSLGLIGYQRSRPNLLRGEAFPAPSLSK